MGSMVRVIDGIVFEGHPADELELVVRQLGHGHAEASIRRPTQWREVGPLRPADADLLAAEAVEFADEKREANRKRAARRAVTAVRRLIKLAGMDALLTLTYRVLQEDLDLCKRHLKEFVRRMKRLIPGFQYVAAFERQARGCWHVHMAIHRLPKELPASNGVKVKSYNVVRAVWRGVVGHDNGNIDQSRRRRHSDSGTSKIAAYISKYMLKAFLEGDDYMNRYSRSKELSALPVPVVRRFRSSSVIELIQRAYDEVFYDGCDCWTSLRKWCGSALDRFPLDYSFWITTGPRGPGRTPCVS